VFVQTNGDILKIDTFWNALTKPGFHQIINWDGQMTNTN